MDLPLPKKILWTPREAEEKSWRMFTTVNLLLAVYATIHKVLVPLVVQGSFDPWFLYHFILAFFLYRRDSRATILLSWFGLAYCLAKLAFVSFHAGDAFGGWMAISAWMTEGFSGIFLAYLLYACRRLPVYEIVFAAASGAMLGMLLYVGGTKTASTAARTKAASVSKSGGIATGCETTVKDGLLEILPCGANAGEIEIADKLTLMNGSGAFFNLRIEQAEPSTRYKRNVPLFPSQSFVLETKGLEADARLIVRSDSRKDIGPLVLVVKKTKAAHE